MNKRLMRQRKKEKREKARKLQEQSLIPKYSDIKLENVESVYHYTNILGFKNILFDGKLMSSDEIYNEKSRLPENGYVWLTLNQSFEKTATNGGTRLVPIRIEINPKNIEMLNWKQFVLKTPRSKWNLLSLLVTEQTPEWLCCPDPISIDNWKGVSFWDIQKQTWGHTFPPIRRELLIETIQCLENDTELDKISTVRFEGSSPKRKLNKLDLIDLLSTISSQSVLSDKEYQVL
jgi:hypothetical protein